MNDTDKLKQNLIRLKQKLKFEDKLSTVGFSMGFGLRLNRFRFDFATSRFHLAGSSNLFSFAVNLNDLY